MFGLSKEFIEHVSNPKLEPKINKICQTQLENMDQEV